MMLKVLITFFIASSNVLAVLSCPNIRLDAPGEVMEKAPMQDQALGICYAHTACQMADAQRAKLKIAKGQVPDTKVCSALFAAVTGSENWADRKATLDEKGNVRLPFSGGKICRAYASIQKNNVCPRERIDSFLKKKKISYQSFFNKIYEIEQSLKNQTSSDLFEGSLSHLLLNPIDSWKSYQQKKENQFVCDKAHSEHFYEMLRGIFGVAAPTYAVVQKYFSADLLSSPFDVSMIFKFICSEDERVSQPLSPKCESLGWADAQKEFKTNPFSHAIIDELKRNKMPIAISYCGNLLTKKKGGNSFDGIKVRNGNRLEVYPRDSDKSCGTHSSLVIGSRFNKMTKSCDFLIRNTWGTRCSSYHSDFECEGGNIWVNSSTLQKNIYLIQRL